jgi:WD40 repeat protein
MKLLLSLLLIPCFIFAQTPDCSEKDYSRLMAEAKRLVDKGLYDKAIDKLQSAKVCQPIREQEVNEEIVRVFREVNRQRELAVKNEREARQQKQLASAQRDSTEYQRKIAVEEKERTQKTLEIAEAGRLSSRAREVLAKDKDYVVALRLAEYAFCTTEIPTEEARSTLQDILNEINTSPKQDITLYSHRMKLKYNNTIKYSISPNGKFLAIIKVGSTGSIEIFDLNTFSLIRRDPYSFMFNPIEKFSFSKDGNSYAAFTGYQTIVERTISGERIFSIKHKEGVYDGLYIENKNYLISYNQKSELYVEDATSSNLLMEVKKYWSYKCFSPDGNYVVLSGSNGDSTAWFINLAKKDTTLLKGLDTECNNICISNDSKLIAGGNVLGEIVIWDANTHEIKNKFKAHSSYLHDLSFSSDNSFLVSASADRTVVVWDLKKNSMAYILKNLKDDPKKASLSEDNHKLVTISDKNEIVLWNIENVEFVKTYKTLGSQYCIEFSNDGLIRIIGGSMSSLEGTQIQDFLKDTIYHLPKKDLNNVSSAKISDKNTYAVMCGMGNKAIVWDIDIGQTVASITPKNSLFVRDVAISTDEKYIALALEREGVQIWDWKINTMETAFKGLSWETFTEVAFTKDGNFLVGATDEQVYVWDISNKKLFQKLITDKTQIWDMDISPDGDRIAVGTSGGHILVWEIETWQKIKTIDAHSDYIQAVDFSNNGKLIASAGRDRVIKIWDTSNWQMVRLLNGHTDFVFAVAFVPGDNFLLSSSGDSTIKSWRIDRDFNSRSDVFQLNDNMKTFYGIPQKTYDNLDQIYGIK